MSSARFEVQVRYAAAIDAGDHDRLDQVFTPGAHLDFRQAGGVAGAYPEVKAWLRGAMARFDRLEHVVTNLRPAPGGAPDDTVCDVHATHGYLEGEAARSFVLRGQYHDSWAETEDGSRIVARTFVVLSLDGDI